MGVSVKINNLDKLIKKLTDLASSKTDNLIEAIMLKACFIVQGTAVRLCPVDTGRLRASISSSVSVQPSKVIGKVFTNVEYGPYVEFGTWKMAAQPFLYPALESNRLYVTSYLQKSISLMIREMVRE